MINGEHLWVYQLAIRLYSRSRQKNGGDGKYQRIREPKTKNVYINVNIWASIARYLPPPHPMVMGLYSSAPVPPSPLWCGWWWVVVGGGVPPSPLWCGWCGWWWVVVVVEEVVYVCIWMYQYPPPPCGVGGVGGGGWWWWKKLYMYVYDCIWMYMMVWMYISSICIWLWYDMYMIVYL